MSQKLSENHLKIVSGVNYLNENHQNSILNLPDEILIHILSYITPIELSDLAGVCERFKTLIYNEPSFFDSMEFLIYEQSEANEELPCIAILSECDEYNPTRMNESMLNIIKHDIKIVKKLKINSSHILNSMKSLLIVSSNITTLNIEACRDMETKNIKVDFPNLTLLKSCALSTSFLKLIGQHKIKEFHLAGFLYLSEYSQSCESATQKEVDEFLKTCKDLKVMKIEDYFPHYDPLHHFYHLESFSVKSKRILIDVPVFLEHHKKSLKSLHIDECNESVAFALNVLKLEEFSFRLPESALKVEFTHIGDNYTIKKVEIMTECIESDRFILSKCLNVEMLELGRVVIGGYYTVHYEACFDLDLSTLQLDNLKHLILNQFTSFVKPGIIDSLETLEIKQIQSACEHRAWIELAACCPQLKKIKINHYLSELKVLIKIPRKQLKKLLECCGNLEEFYIGPFFDLSDDFIETLLNFEHKKFRFLKIESNNYDEDSKQLLKFKNSKIRCELVKLEDQNDHFECFNKNHHLY